MKNVQSKIHPFKQKFNEQFAELSESEIQKEILFYQVVINRKLETIQSNTSKMVWFLIVIPIILAIIAVVSAA